MSEEQDQNQQVPAKDRPVKTAQEFTLNAHKSYWPLALAIALCFLMVDVIANNLILLGIGTVLAVAAIIGWGLERR